MVVEWEQLLDRAYREAWRWTDMELFAKINSRRKLPPLSPAGLEEYQRNLGGSTATYDEKARPSEKAPGEVVALTPRPKTKRNLTLKERVSKEQAVLTARWRNQAVMQAQAAVSSAEFALLRLDVERSSAKMEKRALTSQIFKARASLHCDDDDLEDLLADKKAAVARIAEVELKIAAANQQLERAKAAYEKAQQELTKSREPPAQVSPPPQAEKKQAPQSGTSGSGDSDEPSSDNS